VKPCARAKASTTEEPDAGILHVRVWGGGSGQPESLRRRPFFAFHAARTGDFRGKPWSVPYYHRCNALGTADPVIAAHALYTALGDSDDARRSRYRSLFADPIPEPEMTALRDATNGGFVLGCDRFQRQIAVMVGRRTWPGKSGRPKKEPPDANQLELPI
jgi:hypothetical protein